MATSIKELVQQMTENGAEIMEGTVKSEKPLKIQITGDDKLIIGSGITYVPQHLTDYDIQIADAEGRRTVTVHNALKVGERVHVMSFNHAKQYFLLGRVSNG